MTTGGEGGMVTTDDATLWARMWAFKDHGKSYNAVYNKSHPSGFRWLHENFGTNWRMLEIQAVIGLIQLKRMEDWTAKRLKNADVLRATVSTFDCVRAPILNCSSCSGCETINGCTHANYKFYFYVRPERLAKGWSRDRIIETMQEHKIPAFQGSCSEVYREKAFEVTSYRPSQRLPTALELGETSIMMLVHPTLTEAEMRLSTDVLSQVLTQAQG